MKSKIHPLDAELFKLVDDHAPEQDRFPVPVSAVPEPELSPEEEALYRRVWGDEREVA